MHFSRDTILGILTHLSLQKEDFECIVYLLASYIIYIYIYITVAMFIRGVNVNVQSSARFFLEMRLLTCLFSFSK